MYILLKDFPKHLVEEDGSSLGRRKKKKQILYYNVKGTENDMSEQEKIGEIK